ncbi:MAG: nucleotidyl transferase AbiEii/AbiGii toxin family protein [Bacteroidales bacterium]|nr:MAG: nucleotidyl transferase AbiEii/AbiGii toxin family protein [Bacteroidales bacterium]
MILQKEIASIALQNKVAKSTIDKDWALGHFLDAIFSIPELRDKLIFKGGTCLKKCYFPDYRFSEDLDFTSTDKGFNLTKKHLSDITKLLTERVDLPTQIESLREIKYKNSLAGYEAMIKFWGSDHPRNETPPPPQRWQTKIKIEIILYELLIFPTTTRDINHNYSDKLTENSRQINCYSINEVLAEKMRSLIQRSYSAPRDFYDIWYLSNQFNALDYTPIIDAFHKKLEFKGYQFTGVEQLINPENEKSLRSAWTNSLSHQISGNFPEFDLVKNELLTLFTRIFK